MHKLLMLIPTLVIGVMLGAIIGSLMTVHLQTPDGPWYRVVDTDSEVRFVMTPPAATVTPLPTATNTPVPQPTATDTPVPRPTNTPVPTPTPEPQLSDWHAPGNHDQYGDHEHGDAPPQWVLLSNWAPTFDHPEAHQGFKGYTLSDDGIQVYALVHVIGTPKAHRVRYHSYKVWALDSAGNVSFWQGFMDFNSSDNPDPALGPNLEFEDANNCDSDFANRPIINTQLAGCGQTQFESWYAHSGDPEWSWDFGFNFEPIYFDSETTDPNDSSTWVATGALGLNRRIELAWYVDRFHPVGSFCALPYGDIVPCGTADAMEQYIAPTMTSFEFPGNAVQKSYPGPATLPN